MSRPAVFFDRDNTLIANSDYLGDPEGVRLLTGAAQAVARVRALGFATVIVSNQSGVARGMFTEDDVRAVNARMDKMLLDENPDALIEHHEFCSFHPDGTVEAFASDHERRKPKPGMFFDAARTLDLNLKKSWLIGDAPRDVEAGRRAGCRTILVREPLDSISPAASETLRVQPDYIASSLMDAVDFIEMQLEHPTPAGAPPLPIAKNIETETAAIVETATLAHPPQPPSVTMGSSSSREQTVLLERVVEELRRSNDPPQDFSIARMIAGILQGIALATFFAALIYRDTPPTFNMLILVAIFLQAMVSSFILMGR